jgi:hypothetical protein
VSATVSAQARGGGVRYGRRAYVEMMRADYEAQGEVPRISQWEARPDRPSRTSVRRQYGSWSGLVRAAGLEPRQVAANMVQLWPLERMAALYRTDCEALGRPPSVRDWAERPDRPGVHTVAIRGGLYRVAEAAGCPPPERARSTPHRQDWVPVAPLREAFLRSGVTATEVARVFGWLRSRKGRRGHRYVVADSTRVLRTLGLASYWSKGGVYVRTYVGEERAAELARAIGVAPHEVGI